MVDSLRRTIVPSQILAEIPPFSQHRSDPQILLQLAQGNLPALLHEQSEKGFPAKVQPLLELCWSMSPERRPSMEECLQAIRVQLALCESEVTTDPELLPIANEAATADRTGSNAMSSAASSSEQLTMAHLTNLSPEILHSELKKEGSDLLITFNPQTQRKLAVSLTPSLPHER